ncbi:MAG TPA: glutathione S-transferase family protein [Alphaproteobacteria bacterium]|nr:glutathione S-transferase family protein [Alphaproteobacteria bacterium]
MRVLYHLWLSPQCRKVRLALAEKGLPFDMQVEKVWERRHEFLAVNPAGDVPVLIEEDGTAISDSVAIIEYLEEVHPDRPLISGSPTERAEIRRLAQWFDVKFGQEVSDNLVGEKVLKKFLGLGQPDSAAIRAGHANIRIHLEYVSWLADRRRFLAGDTFSLADLAAAAHLSAVDYIGDVPWDVYPRAKEWYVRIKSRPSFRPVLADHIPGLRPPVHYADLDF